MAEEKKTTTSAANILASVSKGTLKLAVPIADGDRSYDTLTYDFSKLTGWEMAQALDFGAGKGGPGMNTITDAQALSLFATAAAKGGGGLDAVDIRERVSARDAIVAIGVAQAFFRASWLEGSSRISNE